MIPVVTPDEMRAIDEAAPEPVEVLIARAGNALAATAVRMLGGGAYGRRVVVVVGKGNNGADGRAAAERLRRRGAEILVLDAAEATDPLPAADLVIDAAYGTGFHGDYHAPDPRGAPVLAADIPSGVDGRTGVACEGAVKAQVTVTFAALKPGLLFGDGPAHAGEVVVADIGLDLSGAAAYVVGTDDARAWVPPRPRDAHKYTSGVAVVAGSPGMLGAALLCSGAAMRAGAGYVRLACPGVDHRSLPAGEHVGWALPEAQWDGAVMQDLHLYRALVVGPGLGREQATRAAVRRLVTGAQVPVVVDGDGLYAFDGPHDLSTVASRRARPTVLTPHAGEFGALAGAAPGPDRLGEARAFAAYTGVTVLLKGPTTVVARPDGLALLTVAPDARLATAGTGDVLSGIIGALLAQGLNAHRAAAGGSALHIAAAGLASARGMVAGDIIDRLPAVLSS
jgi:ADP-dependent NAD(P)H-hydrate dehydratase / NAD(P)H-hydrate epimerase